MPDLLTAAEAADLLRVSPRTLKRWRRVRDDGPPFVNISPRAIRYPSAELRTWADNARVARRAEEAHAA